MTSLKVIASWKNKIKPEWKLAFMATILLGLLIHIPVLVSDIPNHDGLHSMYFDQNMITSGRWFLTVACGLSSYFTLPWLIGVLGIVFLGFASVALTELFDTHSKEEIILLSGLLVSFPALCSTFAYVFTLDGYMLALFLAIMAVLCVKKFKHGILWGAICLALSMGTYQIYLSFAVLLCMYRLVRIFMEQGLVKNKIKESLRYLYMGGIGVILYYVMLRILLLIQNKELDTYQGIDGMGSLFENGLVDGIKTIYADFVKFTVTGRVLVNNIFSVAAVMILAGLVLFVLAQVIGQRKWWKKSGLYLILLLMVVGSPVAANLILLISPQVNYHLLMRYQWVIFLIIAVDLLFSFGREKMKLVGFFAAAVMIFNYGVTDNIAYSNLQKKYEKTYAYCLRLLDRIEQTEGYYQGIPIAMIGVVGDKPYPVTDITGEVTGPMIGMNGDVLVYTGENYQSFMKNYLGATLNFLEPSAMDEMYYSKEYMEMDSFPGKNSIKIMDGILYIKTENKITAE